VPLGLGVTLEFAQRLEFQVTRDTDKLLLLVVNVLCVSDQRLFSCKYFVTLITVNLLPFPELVNRELVFF